jgi:acetyl-CoA carboxylase carboxyltransferase component
MEIQRQPGENDRGVVAWKMTMKTPEYPDGRDIIVIANDITYLIGSFGVAEHELYKQASVLSRQLGIPRLYIAANSGARIGLAEEVKSVYGIAWVDETKPEKGSRYLYLTPEQYNRLSPTSVICDATPIEEVAGELRYRLTDIIGKQDSLGVENLKGSGLIAGETSEAYRDVVTISLVTCRTVGIGAYVVRLGQRIVQVENAHIILTGEWIFLKVISIIFEYFTGAPALNKLLGKEVYTSSNQLGGIQIMHTNGITHAAVRNDYDGVVQMLKWLAYMPKSKGAPLPVTICNDPIDRTIDFVPTRTPYDPRWMLAGRVCAQPRDPSLTASDWQSGFFDKNSWDEIMSAWAKTVVCGRARLGGIPVGVIAVETRTVELEIPADPATADSETKMLQQAGQVWYPDSAYKVGKVLVEL